MTPESMVALGARLVLIQRFYLPMRLVVAMTDEDAVTVASTALTAADQMAEHAARGAR
jgi:hypothetical protein